MLQVALVDLGTDFLDRNGAVPTQKNGLITALSLHLPLPDRFILWWEM